MSTTKSLVSGLINVETTLRVDSFPVRYAPVLYPFFGIGTTVSGVGFNVARALATLGDAVDLLSVVGRDLPGRLVLETLRDETFSTRHVVDVGQHTPQSVILYDPKGTRQIHVDLKDVQDRAIPPDRFEEAATGCDLAVLCNVNFSRPLLGLAAARGIPIATDVHAISSLDDEYNLDFMKAARILFMSDENLPVTPELWVEGLLDAFGTEIVVVGCGASGALLSVKRDNFLERIPAVRTRPIVNTIGAGDALFAAFLHFYMKFHDPYDALELATVFASHKIGESGAAQGFLNEAALMELRRNLPA